MANKKTCNRCGEEIMFTWDNALSKWVLVEPFVLDAGDRYLQQNKTKIPFDANRHSRHHCTNRDNTYNDIYRG